jgi:hypothetical protein
MSGTTITQNGTVYNVTYDIFELGPTTAWDGSGRWSLGVVPTVGATPEGTASNGDPQYGVTEAYLGSEGGGTGTTLRPGAVDASGVDSSDGLIVGASQLEVTGALDIGILPLQNDGEIVVAAGGTLTVSGVPIEMGNYGTVVVNGLPSISGVLWNGGTINSGNVIEGAGGVFIGGPVLPGGPNGIVSNSTTFSDITVSGIIDLTRSGYSVNDFANDTFSSSIAGLTSGSGPVEVLMNGVSSAFVAVGQQTLADLLFQFGTATGTIDVQGTTGAGSSGSATITPTTTFDVANTELYVQNDTTLVNQAAIVSTGKSDKLVLNGQAFISGVILPGYAAPQTLLAGVIQNDGSVAMAAPAATYAIGDIDFLNEADGTVNVGGGTLWDTQITSKFYNAGSVTVSDGGALYAFDKQFTNDTGGTLAITQDANGAGTLTLGTQDIQQTFVLNVSGPSYVNNGLIELTSSVAGGPGPLFAIVGGILDTGTIVNGSGHFAFANNGTIVLGAGTLSLSLTTLTGGTITGDGGLIASGTIVDALLTGLVDLSAPTTLDGDSFAANALYSSVIDAKSQLIIENIQILDNLTLNMGAAGDSALNLLGLMSPQLTLGAHATLNAIGNVGTIMNWFASGGSTISASFDNLGAINATGGALDIETTMFQNDGQVTVGANATFNLLDRPPSASGPYKDATNAADGAIVVQSGGQLSVGNYAIQEILTNAGFLQIDSGAYLSGEVFLAANDPLVVQSGGILNGATISGPGTIDGDGATAWGLTQLSGVVYSGALNVQGTVELSGSPVFLPATPGPNADLIDVANSPAIGGTAELALVADGMTLPAATIDVGAAGAPNWIAANAGVTLGAGVVVDQTGQYAGLRTDPGIPNPGLSDIGTVDLQGQLNVTFANGVFVIQGLAGFTNDGTINVGNGDTLDVTSAFTQDADGVLNVASGGVLMLQDGATLPAGAVLGFAAGSTLDLSAPLTGGTLDLAGVDVDGASAGSGALDGVTINDTPTTIEGTVTFQNDTYYGSPVIAGDLQLASGNSFLPATAGGATPTIDIVSYPGTLDFVTSQTLVGADIAVGGAAGAPGVVLVGAAGTSVAVTLGAGAAITQTGAVAGGMGELVGEASGASSFDNLGTVEANQSGGTLAVGSLAGFANDGAIMATGGGEFLVGVPLSQNADGTLQIAAGSTLGVSGTSLTVAPNALVTLSPGATLSLASGGIAGSGTVTGDGATVVGTGTLSGVTWVGSPTIGGQLTLEPGLSFLPAASEAAPGLSVLGNGAALDVASSQVLSGLNIALGAPSGGASAAAISAGAGTLDGSLDLDGDTLTQTDAFATLGGFGTNSTIESTGTVLAGVAGGLFSIQGLAAFDNEGTVLVQNGDSLLAASAVTNNGTILDQASATFNASLSGAGTVSLSDGAAVVLNGAVGSGEQIALADGLITIGNVVAFQGTIENFGTSDTLDLTGESIVSDNYFSGQFVFTDSNDQTYTILLQDTVDPNGSLQVKPDGNGGSYVGSIYNNDLACFAAGTRIRTTRGDVKVELLTAGDLMEVALGDGPQPIVWIGRRTVDCARHPHPRQVWPVRVRAGAFGPGLPVRDLLLSPDHAVYVDDVLIPIRHLVNGSSIAQTPVDAVTYYHVELPRHDVLRAEGLPAESWLDTGNRGSFANGGGAVVLHPDFAARASEARGCAKLVVTGPTLEAVRAAICARGREGTRGVIR